MNIWKGAFIPIVKHRDGCGDITNHVGIVNIAEIISDDFKSGRMEVEFASGRDEVYVFEIDEETTQQATLQARMFGQKKAQEFLARWAEEEMDRLRDEAESADEEDKAEWYG